jgi:hypothetical protein
MPLSQVNAKVEIQGAKLMGTAAAIRKQVTPQSQHPDLPDKM